MQGRQRLSAPLRSLWTYALLVGDALVFSKGTYCLTLHAVAGSVDAGKSSLVGVLTHGMDGRPLLDNGCGSARMNVFQHKHEIETGRTSSLTHQMLGYDDEGVHHPKLAGWALL